MDWTSKYRHYINESQTAQARNSARFLGPRANAELVPKIYVAMNASHAALQKIVFKFFVAKTRPYQNHQNFCIMLPSQYKIISRCSSSVLWRILPTYLFPSPYFLHFPAFYPASVLPLPKGRAGTTLETCRATNSSDFPLPRDKRSASHCTPHRRLYSVSLSHRWTSRLKGLIGLSFGVKYERLQFLLTTEEGDTDESGLTSREWLWKGGTWVFWKYSHCKLRFSVCYKSLLDTDKAFSKENKKSIC
jgi:hypothetical protein